MKKAHDRDGQHRQLISKSFYVRLAATKIGKNIRDKFPLYIKLNNEYTVKIFFDDAGY